jgi:hypothetical protein
MKHALLATTMLVCAAGNAVAQTCTVPAPAAVAGYDTLTYGAPLVVGTTPNPQTSWPEFAGSANLVPFDFFGTSWKSIGFSNSNGAVTLDGSGETYGNGLATASVTPAGQTLNGIAFGGGGYFQVTMAGNGPMSFWANDYEHMNSASIGTSDPNPSWIENDMAEFDSTGVYGFAVHNWHDNNTANGSDSLDSGSPASPAGANYAQPNNYGFLWVPATPGAQGQASFWFNGQQVGNTLVWNMYVPGQSAPSNPFSVMDALHMIVILGANPGTSVTFSNLQVWQKSSAGDIGTLVTSGSVQTPCSEYASAAAPADVTASATAGIIQDPTPGEGSATDTAGNVWTVNSQNQILENGIPAIGGGDTSQLLIEPDGTVYGLSNGQNGSSTNWFIMGSTSPTTSDNWQVTSTAPAGATPPTAPPPPTTTTTPAATTTGAQVTAAEALLQQAQTDITSANQPATMPAQIQVILNQAVADLQTQTTADAAVAQANAIIAEAQAQMAASP